MPYPILPVNELTAHSYLFGNQPISVESELKDYNMHLLSQSALQKEAISAPSDKIITMLETIDKYQNDNQTAVQAMVGQQYDKVCSVPLSITDGQLLNLKTDGYVSGYSRQVTFTNKGKLALRDHYLNTENALKKGRAIHKFDYQAALDKFEKSGDNNGS